MHTMHKIAKDETLLAAPLPLQRQLHSSSQALHQEEAPWQPKLDRALEPAGNSGVYIYIYTPATAQEINRSGQYIYISIDRHIYPTI